MSEVVVCHHARRVIVIPAMFPFKIDVRFYVVGVTLYLCATTAIRAAPPLSGTIFMDPDIITDTDLSLFEKVSFKEEGERLVFDRRLNRWVTMDLFLFETHFATGRTVETRVNKEFGPVAAAETLAESYGRSIGRIPIVLMKHVDSITIHDGVNPFGGGNRNLLIHHGQGLLYKADGILEEVFVHEAAHTSLDMDHASAEGWKTAQAQDPEFISDYASDFPEQEDIAESFLAFLAVEHRRERIDEALANLTSSAIPGRIEYFRSQGFDLYPLIPLTSTPALGLEVVREGAYLLWSHDFPQLFQVAESSDLFEWMALSDPPELMGQGQRARLDISHRIKGSSRFYRLEEAVPDSN